MKNGLLNKILTPAILLVLVIAVIFSMPATVAAAEPAQNNLASTTSVASTTNNSLVFEKDYLTAAKEKFEGSTVHILMWRQYTQTEKSLVDSFYQKTGIKIRTTVTTEAEYATKLAALISGKDSPDVVCFNSEDFPAFVVNSLQPLKNSVFKLDDPIWYKPYMDNYSVNGKHFAVAINGAWITECTNYVTYYNPNALVGLADPYELYKQGRWNWSAAKEIATAVSQKGSNYMGMSLQSKDLYMLSAGLEFISYDGKQFTNNLDDGAQTKSITAAWNEVSTLVSDNLVKRWDPQGISNGTTGLFSAIAFGLYNEGGWFDNVTTKGGVEALKAVPVAGPDNGLRYVPSRPNVFGVAKGAKNPEATAYFLRYFLDPSNCDMDKTFYNDQFKEVFNIITNKTTRKQVLVTCGVMDYTTEGSYLEFCDELASAAPAQQTTIINKYQSRFATNIKRANNQLQNIIGGIPGDLNQDDQITDRDGVYLMYHIFNPNENPVEQDCDFDNNGVINDRDAVYLLYYTFDPENYPIN